jgi:formate/nitrite transporter FocA (FNT family)
MFGARRVLETPPLHIVMLAGYGGALSCAGALFSVLLSAGVETAGPRRLLEGLGFSSGFFLCHLIACNPLHGSQRSYARGPASLLVRDPYP